MKALIIENVRCFRSPGPIPLAQLTLLLGENGTGKTTFLSCARLSARLSESCGETPDFAEEPFPLGYYANVVRLLEDGSGGAPSFKVGFECDANLIDPETYPACNVVGMFGQRNYRSFLSGLTIKTNGVSSVFSQEEEDDWQVADKLSPVSPLYSSIFASDPAVPFWNRPQKSFQSDLDLVRISRRHGGERCERLKAALEEFGNATGLFSELKVEREEGQGGSP